MRINKTFFLSSLWIKEIFKKPLTWFIFMFFIFMVRGVISVSAQSNYSDYYCIYFSSVIIPFIMIISNTMSIDFVFNISLKDGVFYYLASSPLKISEIIISKALSLFFTAFLFVLVVFGYIFIINHLFLKFVIVNFFFNIINSFVLYGVLLSFIFYILFRRNFISPYINSIILLSSVFGLMGLIYITDGLKKYNEIIILIPKFTMVFNFLGIVLMFFIFKNTKREKFLT